MYRFFWADFSTEDDEGPSTKETRLHGIKDRAAQRELEEGKDNCLHELQIP